MFACHSLRVRLARAPDRLRPRLAQAEPADLREAMVGEDLLHRHLVHRCGARQHARAHIGYADKFQHALYRAVFSIWPVQDGEHDVYPAEEVRR